MTFSLEAMPNLKGRIAIVTGANAGLGFETAQYLAQKQATVVLACRSQSKAENAVQRIKNAVPDCDLHTMELDLSRLSSVRSFAQAFRSSFQRLDLLINNAGIMYPPYSLTEDGFENQMGTNHMGHFLLTSLLLDLIPDSPESRIVALSSIAHKTGKIDFEDMDFRNGYSKVQAYCQSKLANLMFAFGLDQKLRASGSQIRALAAHPGGSFTELMRHVPGPVAIVMKTFGGLLSHPPHEAALPTMQAALDPDAQGGEYYGPQGFMEMSGASGIAKVAKQARKQDVIDRLWEVSAERTGAQYPFASA